MAGEQVELTLRNTGPVVTTWGFALDRRLRIAPANAGSPAAASKEYNTLIGWTLTGVNGQPAATPARCAELLGAPAAPGGTITIHARAPAPAAQAAAAAPAAARPAAPRMGSTDALCGHPLATGGPPEMLPGFNGQGGARLIVRNLISQITRGDLERMFTPFGTICDVHIPNNRRRGVGAGDYGKPAYAFVQYMTMEEGDKAINALNGTMYKGFGPITVRLADGTPQSVGQMMQKRNPLFQGMDDNADMASANAPSRTLRADMEPAKGLVGDQMRIALERIQEVKRLLKEERREGGELKLRLLTLQQDHGGGDPSRKLEKYKAKLERYREAEQVRAGQDIQTRNRALKAGVERATDEEIRALSAAMGALSAGDARQILELDPDAAGGDPAASAKRLMAKLHPDRVAVDICKDGLRARFQLVQHARDVLAAPAAAPAGGGAGGGAAEDDEMNEA